MTATVAAIPAAQLLTAAELLALPDDGNRYELARGELITMPPPSLRHTIVTGRLCRRIGNFVEEHGLPYFEGPEAAAYIEQNPDTVRAADYALYPRWRIPSPLPDQGYIPGLIPELVVEVIAPGYGAARAAGRARMWLDAGAALVAMAYIATSAVVTHAGDGTVRRFATGDALILEPTLPGFTCPVADIFAL